MQQSDRENGVGCADPKRGARTVSLALTLALVTGIGGAVALFQATNPASAQTSLLGSQIITPTTFSELAREVTPAVVAIQVRGVRGEGRNLEQMIPRDGPFRDFFERFFDDPEDLERFGRRGGSNGDRPRRPRMSQGSGFIISDGGYIVTNDHVIDKADTVIVVTNDGERHEAEVIGTDERTDLAVLKIDVNDKLPFVSFSTEEVEVGAWVMAVGNPFGLGGTVTTGIVSANGRSIGGSSYNDFIQIDAAVNRGNSGGPSFNLDGKVIGVNSSIYSPNGGSVGIGFAIPSTVAAGIIEQLIDHGRITRGWLGVSIQTLTPDIAESVGLDEPTGAIVAEVFAGSPAEKADIQPGDVVLEVDGREIGSSRDLARLIAGFTPDQTVEVKVFRNRRDEVVEIELGSMPENPLVASHDTESAPKEQKLSRLAELGIEVEPASETDDDADARGVVVTRVDSDGEAAAKGISRGDRILRVAGVETNTPEQLDAALSEARDDGLSTVLALVRSGNGQRFVTFELTET